MLKNFDIIRNVGTFDSFTGTQLTELGKLSLVYAENGLGKTTISAVISSLANQDSNLILERHRFNGVGTPHVVLSFDDLQNLLVFQNGNWSGNYSDILVLDDHFVDTHVYSGLTVTANQRRHLHELIIGRTGVSLARQLESITLSIEVVTSQLRQKGTELTADICCGLDHDTFLGLAQQQNISTLTDKATQQLNAVRNADTIRATADFPAVSPFPALDLTQLIKLLDSCIEDVSSTVIERIVTHLRHLGTRGESWIAEGMDFSEAESSDSSCPFCGLDLTESELFDSYKAYFSEEYNTHKESIQSYRYSIETLLGGPALASFQSLLHNITSLYQYWSNFLSLPDFTVFEEDIISQWNGCYSLIQTLLQQKLNKPLDRIALSEAENQQIRQFIEFSDSFNTDYSGLVASNTAIQQMRTNTENLDLPTAESNLNLLRATQNRYRKDISPICDEYQLLQDQKLTLEQQKIAVRGQLDVHRAIIIPQYEQAINRYLNLFNAGFRIVEVQATNPRGVPSSTFSIEINTTRLPITGQQTPGRPSFRSTLSSGDRSTLALAFFFAWIDNEPTLDNLTLVIDDPVSSLDDGRMIASAQKVRSLASQCKQVIILSHSKQFLFTIWNGYGDLANTSTLQVIPAPNGSQIAPWDIHAESVNEYDKNHKLLRDFFNCSHNDSNRTAIALRPTLEGFLRTACTSDFPPGTLLGSFIAVCKDRITNGDPILSASLVQGLDELRDYSNRFHHSSNQQWERALQNISETELRGFVRRVLEFTKK